MALPIRDYVASQAVEGALGTARQLRNKVQQWKTQIDSGPTTADVLIVMMLGIKSYRDNLNAFMSVSGLDVAAKEEFNDPSLSLTTELGTIIQACTDVGTWMVNNFPKDGNGYLLREKIVGGELEQRTFSVAALSGLSTQLGNLLSKFS